MGAHVCTRALGWGREGGREREVLLALEQTDFCDFELSECAHIHKRSCVGVGRGGGGGERERG